MPICERCKHYAHRLHHRRIRDKRHAGHGKDEVYVHRWICRRCIRNPFALPAASFPPPLDVSVGLALCLGFGVLLLLLVIAQATALAWLLAILIFALGAMLLAQSVGGQLHRPLVPAARQEELSEPEPARVTTPFVTDPSDDSSSTALTTVEDLRASQLIRGPHRRMPGTRRDLPPA
jgi:hypothetical protein